MRLGKPLKKFMKVYVANNLEEGHWLIKSPVLDFIGPDMLKHAQDYVKKCDRCQRFAPIVRQLPEMLTSINTPIPFAMWGMDILGPFPLASAQRKFLLVAIDYFTKWIEAKPMAKITTKQVAQFV